MGLGSKSGGRRKERAFTEKLSPLLGCVGGGRGTDIRAASTTRKQRAAKKKKGPGGQHFAREGVKGAFRGRGVGNPRQGHLGDVQAERGQPQPKAWGRGGGL